MTREEWLVKFKQNQAALTDFVVAWHPRSVCYGNEDVLLPVTAPNAEISCQTVRDRTEPVNVGKMWSKAIDDNDADTLSTLLSQAWFGVPESTSCWRLRGFPEAVALLDDPIEYDGPEEPNAPPDS